MNKQIRSIFYAKIIFYIVVIVYSSYIFSYFESTAEKYQLYFWANYNQLESHNDTAQKCYDLLFKYYNSPHLYPGFLLHLTQLQQFDTIARLIPTVEATQKQDLKTQLLFITALEKVGRHNDSMQRLIQLSKEYPDNPEIIYYTAIAHVENNHFEEALSALNSYLGLAPHATKNFIFFFLKAQIFARIGKQEDAIINVKKSLELFPGFDQGWLLLGLIHELAGNLEEAFNNYQSCLKIVGSNPLLERQILHLQLKRQQLMQNKKVNHPFIEAITAYDQKQYQKALQIINQSTLLQDHTPSRLLKIELLCKINQADQAIELLIQWINNDATNETWYRTLHLLHKTGVPTSTILNAFSQLEQKNDKNILPLLYKSDIYLRMQEKQQAMDYLHKSLQYAHEPIMRTKILFQLSLLYYHDKKWDNMHKALVEGKSLNQNFSPLLNLLAYYYATTGNNLKEAEQLMHRILKQDKNPHFLDTYALILYKQKKFDQAYNLLSTITQQIPQDSTVLYHLAKTMRKKGLDQEAITILHQALNYCSITDNKDKYKKCLQVWSHKK